MIRDPLLISPPKAEASAHHALNTLHSDRFVRSSFHQILLAPVSLAVSRAREATAHTPAR